MTEPLEFTGERFTPECEREIWYEHLHRYAFAVPLCTGRTVLDAACGEGYGAALLAKSAAQVTGLDLSGEAIEHARRRYPGVAGLTFESGDVSSLPFEDASFDCVVSFETIEHVEAQEKALAEFRRVLRPDGFLLISSPDKAEYTDAHGNDNPFHVKELYREEFESLLAGQFPAVRLLGQKLMFHSVIWNPDGAARTSLQTWIGGELDHPAVVPHPAMYWLAVCAASFDLLPPLPSDLWLFGDDRESVYEHYLGEIRRNMAAGGIIAERDREIEALRGELEAARAGAGSWLGRLFRR